MFQILMIVLQSINFSFQFLDVIIVDISGWLLITSVVFGRYSWMALHYWRTLHG
jgi:hypothetical protein